MRRIPTNFIDLLRSEAMERRANVRSLIRDVATPSTTASLLGIGWNKFRVISSESKAGSLGHGLQWSPAMAALIGIISAFIANSAITRFHIGSHSTNGSSQSKERLAEKVMRVFQERIRITTLGIGVGLISCGIENLLSSSLIGLKSYEHEPDSSPQREV